MQLYCGTIPRYRCSTFRTTLNWAASVLPPYYRRSQACALLCSFFCACNRWCTGVDRPTLQVIDLTRTNLTNGEVPALAEQLCKFPALKGLDVSNNPGLGCIGASSILSSLADADHPALWALVLTRTNLTNEGVLALVEQLRKFPALRILHVTDNPGLGSGGAGTIVSSLAGACHITAAIFLHDSLHTTHSNPRMRHVLRRHRLRSRE